MLPIAHGYSAQAYQASVQGAHANPLTPNEYARMKGPKDTFVYVQAGEPITLDCPDETDGETFNACGQIFEQLLGFKPGTIELVPQLASEFKANDTATEWTFKLRPNVKFHDGTMLDANDVVVSYLRQWDAAHPLHKGDTGTFQYFQDYFGPLLNAKK
jgi:peptide/nickel transport system substrate-binding protein